MAICSCDRYSSTSLSWPPLVIAVIYEHGTYIGYVDNNGQLFLPGSLDDDLRADEMWFIFPVLIEFVLGLTALVAFLDWLRSYLPIL